MLRIEIDYSKCNSDSVEFDSNDIFDNEHDEYRCNMISFICDALYMDGAELCVEDGKDKCKYIASCDSELPFVFDMYDDIISGLKYKRDFIVDSYEQGREFCIKFTIDGNFYDVDINHWYGKKCLKEHLEYNYVKEMFMNFFSSIFRYVRTRFIGIEKNEIFLELMNIMYD